MPFYYSILIIHHPGAPARKNEHRLFCITLQQEDLMKRTIALGLLLLTASSAFARPCKVWTRRHHHRVCVRR
jgi:hypothetical protein